MTPRALIEIGRQFGRVEQIVKQIGDAFRALETVLDGNGPQATADEIVAACLREAVALERGAAHLANEANRLGAIAGASRPQLDGAGA